MSEKRRGMIVNGTILVKPKNVREGSVYYDSENQRVMIFCDNEWKEVSSHSCINS